MRLPWPSTYGALRTRPHHALKIYGVLCLLLTSGTSIRFLLSASLSLCLQFWKQNEIGLKARAIGELIVEETSKMDIKVPSKPAKASKAPKAAAPKAAAKSKDVPKQAKSKRAKPAFEMPKFEMPKFEPPAKK